MRVIAIASHNCHLNLIIVILNDDHSIHYKFGISHLGVAKRNSRTRTCTRTVTCHLLQLQKEPSSSESAAVLSVLRQPTDDPSKDAITLSTLYQYRALVSSIRLCRKHSVMAVHLHVHMPETVPVRSMDHPVQQKLRRRESCPHWRKRRKVYNSYHCVHYLTILHKVNNKEILYAETIS